MPWKATECSPNKRLLKTWNPDLFSYSDIDHIHNQGLILLINSNPDHQHQLHLPSITLGDQIAVKTTRTTATKSTESGTCVLAADEVSSGLLWAAAINVFSALLKA